MSNSQQPTISKLKIVIHSGQAQETPSPKFISKLGTIVYSNLIFNKYKPGRVQEGEYTWEDFRIDDVLMAVSRQTKIITTAIQGRDGTVKEYIGMDDYQIKITGRLSGSYNVNPKEQTKILKNILSAKIPLEVTSWWLQNLDITDIVVTNFDFRQTEGEYSTQYFNFTALSDAVMEITISDNTKM